MLTHYSVGRIGRKRERPRRGVQRTGPGFLRQGTPNVGYMPDSTQIVARNEEIRRLATALNPTIIGDDPSNVFLYGKTGTGKWLCARYTTNRISDTAAENDVQIGRVVVDRSQENTETRAVREVAQRLNAPEETGIDVLENGSIRPTTASSGRFSTRSSTSRSSSSTRSIASRERTSSCNYRGLPRRRSSDGVPSGSSASATR